MSEQRLFDDSVVVCDICKNRESVIYLKNTNLDYCAKCHEQYCNPNLLWNNSKVCDFCGQQIPSTKGTNVIIPEKKILCDVCLLLQQ